MGLFRSKNNARLLYCLRQGRENQDCMQRQRPILSCIAIFSESIEITRQNTTFYMVCEAKWSIHVPKTMLACSTFFDKKERIKTACRGSDRFYHVLPFVSESIDYTQQNTWFYMVCGAKLINFVAKTMLACCTFFDKAQRIKTHAEAATDFSMYCHSFQKVSKALNRTQHFTWFVRPNGFIS